MTRVSHNVLGTVHSQDWVRMTHVSHNVFGRIHTQGWIKVTRVSHNVLDIVHTQEGIRPTRLSQNALDIVHTQEGIKVTCLFHEASRRVHSQDWIRMTSVSHNVLNRIHTQDWITVTRVSHNVLNRIHTQDWITMTRISHNVLNRIHSQDWITVTRVSHNVLGRVHTQGWIKVTRVSHNVLGRIHTQGWITVTRVSHNVLGRVHTQGWITVTRVSHNVLGRIHSQDWITVTRVSHNVLGRIHTQGWIKVPRLSQNTLHRVHTQEVIRPTRLSQNALDIVHTQEVIRPTRLSQNALDIVHTQDWITVTRVSHNVLDRVQSQGWMPWIRMARVSHVASNQSTSVTLHQEAPVHPNYFKVVLHPEGPVHPNYFQATDKLKKRLQKRYFANEAEAAEREKKMKESKGQKRRLEDQSDKKWPPPAVETFNLEHAAGQVTSHRGVQRWKKQRLQAAEEARESGSKSKKSQHKRGKPSHAATARGMQQKNGRKKAEKKSSKLDDVEEPGLIEYGSDEDPDRLTQTEIAEAVDVTSASKYFELNLTEFGPYSINYSRNGSHLLLGGLQGHVAAFEWQTKRLVFEMNTDHTDCVQWLHQETMLAAAHPSGVCFYDNTGMELHALTNLDSVMRMEFLPHHMLLATANAKGFLGFTDVSLGTRVAGHCTGMGRLDVMTHNPANAVVCLGHASGTVTLWSPSVKRPLVKMLTHKAPVRAIAVDSTGNYLATSSVDKRVKVFDLRTYKMLAAVKAPLGATSLDFSQRGLLAAAMGNRVQVYKDCRGGGVVAPYLSHVTNGSLRNVEFCPFEDVLGAGHQRGFCSLLVPGSGEPNIDALSVNPLATKKQRQNMEVRLLLDKLQPEMIGLTNWLWDMQQSSSSSPSSLNVLFIVMVIIVVVVLQLQPEMIGLTNWLWDMQQSSSSHRPRPPTPTSKKMGNKQKEEQQREKTRASLKERTKGKGKGTESRNPLSRFRKS
ncbi:hypothetical protein ACOMHN_001920 [Nucella lapillus]